MAGAPYRLVTLPNGQQVRMPTSQVSDFMAGQTANTAFQDSASMPIPGLTGPVSNGSGIPNTPWRGLLPMNQLPQQPSQFQPMGPYGAQAMQDAGLLGMSQSPQQPTGLLGSAKRPYTMMMGGKYGK